MIDIKIKTIPYLIGVKENITCKVHNNDGNGIAHDTIIGVNSVWNCCKAVINGASYVIMYNSTGTLSFWSTAHLLKKYCQIVGKDESWKSKMDEFNNNNNFFHIHGTQ